MSNLTRDSKIKVTNRSNGTVILKVQDRHFRAELNPKETRVLNYGDILDVAAQPGGRNLIYNFLLIQDAEALRQGLNVKEEPEYWLTEEKIPSWMNTCSLDEFKDALQFAPQGVLDLIKKYAVSQPLNDMAKRIAIKDALQFDVTLAITNNEKSGEDEAANAPSARRRSASVSYEVPGEEAASTEPAPKYKRTTPKNA
ncbi:MAG: hypothetical protein IKY94_15290 [Lachnospiraceae bacterium]|jgi:hypothetical protein|nr:hypothetical protein [Lachnospiraceae bacterium]